MPARELGVHWQRNHHYRMIVEHYMRRSLLVLAALALGVANPASGTVVKLEGDTEHGEVCRFRAGDGDDPFQRWLSSAEVTCVASESSMTFPKGGWNVFG